MDQWIIRSQVPQRVVAWDAVQRPDVGGGLVALGCARALKIWSDSPQKCEGQDSGETGTKLGSNLLWFQSTLGPEKSPLCSSMAWPFLVGGVICLV